MAQVSDPTINHLICSTTEGLGLDDLRSPVSAKTPPVFEDHSDASARTESHADPQYIFYGGSGIRTHADLRPTP